MDVSVLFATLPGIGLFDGSVIKSTLTGIIKIDGAVIFEIGRIDVDVIFPNKKAGAINSGIFTQLK